MAKGKIGILLAVLTGVGLVVTVVITANKAPEARAAKEEALNKKRLETGDENAELTKMESIKAQAPSYMPVIFTASATAASLIGSQILPQKAISDLNRWRNAYHDISNRVNGPKAEQLLQSMTEEQLKLQSGSGIKKETFVISCEGEVLEFESTLLDVMEAEYNINRYFHGVGYIKFNEALECFHLDQKVESGDEFGWDMYLGDAYYGYSWIDFQHRRGMKDGKPVTFIDLPFPPHRLDEGDLTGSPPRAENMS